MILQEELKILTFSFWQLHLHRKGQCQTSEGSLATLIYLNFS